MDAKSILTSKTFWANVIGFIVSMAPVFGFHLDVSPETQASITTAILAIVNIALRMFSHQAVYVVK